MINADRFCLGDDQEKKKNIGWNQSCTDSNIPPYSKDKSLCFRISFDLFYCFCICKALSRDPDGSSAV